MTIKTDKLKSWLLFILIIIFILYTSVTQNVYEESVKTINIEERLDFFLKNLKTEEMKNVESIKNLPVSSMSNKKARDLFFRTIAMPLQSPCRIMKRIGGHWHIGNIQAGQHQQVDGDKFVCMDSILRKENCIIYSFGLAADWTFEDMMDRMGCRIFAYDHTINAPPTRGNHIKYFKTGLGYGKDLKPLSQLISENNHDRVEIDYLKIDIEEYEFSKGGFSDWLSSGALRNVNQIAIELHVDHHEENQSQYIELLKHLQDLYKLGFTVISHEPNMVKGPGPDGIYNFVEVVFMKST